jgi:hypothetical protein
MSDEELMKRLRDFGHVDAHIAADRIEELVKNLAFSQKMDAKCVDDVVGLMGKLEAAEAKLAKAVEALQYANRMVQLDLLHMTDWNHKDFSQAVVDTWKRITTTLAELEKTE